MPLIESVLGDDQKQMLLEELAKHTGEFDRFKLQQDITRANQGAKHAFSPNRTQVNKPKLSPLRMLIRLLLDKPELASRCEDVQIGILPAAKQQEWICCAIFTLIARQIQEQILHSLLKISAVIPTLLLSRNYCYKNTW